MPATARLAKLYDRDAQLFSEMETLLSTADAREDGEKAMTEEEEAKYDKLAAERKDVRKQILREEAHRAHERDLDAITDFNDAGDDGASEDGSLQEGKGGQPPGDGLSWGERLQLIHRAYVHGDVDPRLVPEQAASGGSVGVPSDGGYLVRDETSNEIITKAIEEDGEFSSRASMAMTGGGSLKIPFIDETSRADGSRWGGVQAYWAAEAAAVTAKKPKFGKLEIELFKLFALAYATDELLADAMAVESIYSQAFRSELSHKLNADMFEGTGVGQPLGVLNSPGRVTVAKETQQTAATIVYENVLKMWSRLFARSRTRAVWWINPDCEPQLAQMSLPVGTGGVPVYLPPGGATSSPFATLFGRPVIPSEHMKSLGSEGDIALIDWSEYQLVEHREGLRTARSAHVRFLNDEETFRWIQRIGGKPRWEKALTPKNSTNKRSPYVFLAARS